MSRTKVVTGPQTRFSYLNAFTPKPSLSGGKPKYSVSLIIPKSDTKTIKAIESAIQAAYEEGEAKLKGTGKTVPPLSSIRTPLRDGDTDRSEDPAYANAYFINCNSETQPGIVDANCQPVIDPSECYSGCYGRASINAFAYNTNGSKGISFGLNNLQVLRQAESLGVKSRAEDDFAEFKSEGYDDSDVDDGILD